jgi:phage-related baseplate assembly protein
MSMMSLHSSPPKGAAEDDAEVSRILSDESVRPMSDRLKALVEKLKKFD